MATALATGNALDVLRERGFVKDVSNESGLRCALARPITVYCGYDATATSFHIGNLITIMMLAWMQRAGHRPVALVGGGTTLVGDPTGRSRERPMLPPDEIDANIQRLRLQLARFIDFEKDALLLNNADWLVGLNLIDFLRGIGSHFSINAMLAHETYRVRLESGGLTFLELSYQMLQAYDFLHLFREYGCVLEVGGSDQWANILAGTDLIRRVERANAYALVSPLITTAGGRKMSKSEGAAVWLAPDMTSPYAYYQCWINTDDRDVERFLALFTFLPMDEVRRLGSLHGADMGRAKEVLALEATAILHGERTAEEARAVSRALFAGQGSLESAPSADIALSRIAEGLTIADVLVETGLSPSRREARRLCEQGGVRINGLRVDSADHRLTIADLGQDATLLVQVGKKTHLRVRAV